MSWHKLKAVAGRGGGLEAVTALNPGQKHGPESACESRLSLNREWVMLIMGYMISWGSMESPDPREPWAMSGDMCLS
jgi:hypothetical protein